MTTPQAEAHDSSEDLVDRTLRIWADAGMALAPGAEEADLAAAEDRFGFRFAPAHRALLLRASPRVFGWVSWHDLDDPGLSDAVSWPIDSVLFDVGTGAYWQRGWGVRPADDDDAVRVARAEIAEWPRLVPLYGHRYTVSAQWKSPLVFSAYQTGVLVCGRDLCDWASWEFASGEMGGRGVAADALPPWTESPRTHDAP